MRRQPGESRAVLLVHGISGEERGTGTEGHAEKAGPARGTVRSTKNEYRGSLSKCKGVGECEEVVREQMRGDLRQALSGYYEGAVK